jgi:hypothetical protein
MNRCGLFSSTCPAETSFREAYNTGRGLAMKYQTPNQNQTTPANPEVKGIRKPEKRGRGKELKATKADRKVGGNK